MSTYTDLKNRVKENLTVGYADRITTQKAKFLNPENEYAGSFTGKAAITGMTVAGGEMSNVSVYNGLLVDPTLVTSTGSKIDLATIGDEVDALSNEAVPRLDGRIDKADRGIEGLSGAQGAADLRFDEFKAGVDEAIEVLSTAIGDEIADRIDADGQLSAELTAAIRSEAAQRAVDDAALGNRIDAEEDARRAADDRLSVELSRRLDETVEYEKHYHINPVGHDSKMPFKAKEFDVNVIVNYDLPDAFVKDASNGTLVGKVEAFDPETLDCEFVPYPDTPSAYVNVLGTQRYVFKDGGRVRDCADPRYVLTYYASGADRSVTGQRFAIGPAAGGTRKVILPSGEPVGYVTGCGDDMTGGCVTFTRTDGPTAALANGRSYEFSIERPTVEISGLDGSENFVTFVKNGSSIYFDCSLGMKYAKYQPVFDGTQPGTERGRIFQENDDGSYATSSFYQVAFHAPGDPSRRITADMDEADGFEYCVSEAADGARIVLSARPDGRLEYFTKRLVYGHEVDIFNGAETLSAELTIGRYNTAVSGDFETAELDLSRAFPRLPVYREPFVLTADPEGGHSCLVRRPIEGVEWTVSVTMSAGRSVKVTAEAGGMSMSQVGQIRQEPFVAEDESVHDGWVTEPLDWPSFEFDGLEPRPKATLQCPITGRDGHDLPTRELECVLSAKTSPAGTDYSVDSIVIQVPSKPEGSDVSREFLFVVLPRGEGRKASLSFVDELGQPVRWFANKQPKFEILTETFITFKLQEVRDGRFMVVDWNLNRQEQEIADLDRRLRQEVLDRQGADEAEAEARVQADEAEREDRLSADAAEAGARAEKDAELEGRADEIDGRLLALTGRYEATFSPSGHAQGDISADTLRLFDEELHDGEHGHREYAMVLSAGTVVLKRVF